MNVECSDSWFNFMSEKFLSGIKYSHYINFREYIINSGSSIFRINKFISSVAKSLSKNFNSFVSNSNINPMKELMPLVDQTEKLINDLVGSIYNSSLFSTLKEDALKSNLAYTSKKEKQELNFDNYVSFNDQYSVLSSIFTNEYFEEIKQIENKIEWIPSKNIFITDSIFRYVENGYRYSKYILQNFKISLSALFKALEILLINNKTSDSNYICLWVPNCLDQSIQELTSISSNLDNSNSNYSNIFNEVTLKIVSRICQGLNLYESSIFKFLFGGFLKQKLNKQLFDEILYLIADYSNFSNPNSKNRYLFFRQNHNTLMIPSLPDFFEKFYLEDCDNKFILQSDIYEFYHSLLQESEELKTHLNIKKEALLENSVNLVNSKNYFNSFIYYNRQHVFDFPDFKMISIDTK